MAELTLTEVEAAIQAIQTNGQTVSIGDIQYSGANLQALINLREKMVRKNERSSNVRPVFRGFNISGMGY